RPLDAIYLGTMGPQEAVLRIALKKGSGIRIEGLKETMRSKLKGRLEGWLQRRLRAGGVSPGEATRRVQGLSLSFEPADIVSEVMSFGSPTPVEVAVSGTNLDQSRAYAAKVRQKLDDAIPSLRDLQYVQSLDYPSLQIE